MSDNNRKLVIGGIVKHSDGYGFKLTFQNKELAQFYYKMVLTVLEDDFKDITILHSAFDEVKQ